MSSVVRRVPKGIPARAPGNQQRPAISQQRPATERPLRVVGPDGRITSIGIAVLGRGPSGDEVTVNGTVVGYIRRTGKAFVASFGGCPETAVDCGKSELWDKAAVFLLARMGLAQEY